MIRRYVLYVICLISFLSGPVWAAEKTHPLKKVDWSFSGPFGLYDRAAMQRGFSGLS